MPKDDNMPKENRYIPNFILNSPVRNVSRFPLNVISGFINEGSTVVDIGSGPGYYSLKIASLKNNLKVIATDPNPSAIKNLNEAISKRGLTQITTLIESGDSLNSIADSSADFVFSHLMLCCMSNHKGALDETLRILKKGSYAFISVNRGSSERDRRDVTVSEWESIKKRYKVVKEGSTLMSRWIIIQKGTD